MVSPAASAPVPSRLLIVHGYGATVDAHWFPALAEAARNHGISVETVALPTPDSPVRAAWEQAVADSLGTPDAATWIVAHSLGCLTTLRVLENLDESWALGGLVLVAGFSGRLALLPELDDYLAEPFAGAPWSRRISTRIVVHSDDDAIVPPSASAALAEAIEAAVIVEPGAGHFLAENGVTRLPVVEDAVLAHG